MELITCSICGALFTCSHVWITEAYGEPLTVPHCKHCFWDDKKCKDNHGYQCPKCEQFHKEFNP